MSIDRQKQRELLQAILLAEWDDKQPRLVYADWLESQGDPHFAELIRTQLSRLPATADSTAWEQNRQKDVELRRGFGFDHPPWSLMDYPFGGVADYTDWSIEIDQGRVTLWIHQLPPHGPIALPPKECLERLGWVTVFVGKPPLAATRLTTDEEGIEALLVCPLMDHCLELGLVGLGLGDEAIRRLAASPRMQKVSSLLLGNNKFGPRGARAVAQSPHLSELLKLSLSQNALGDEGVVALAGATFPSLRDLHLRQVNAGPDGITALARAPVMRALRSLGLDGNRLSPESAAALASTSSFALTQLSLADWGPDDRADEIAQSLAAASSLDQLVELNLSSNPVSDIGAEALIRSPRLPRLQKIRLDWTNISGGAIRAMAETDRFFRSGDLCLMNCDINDEALEALAASPHSALLETLRFCEYSNPEPFPSTFTDRGARLLASSPHLKNLRSLGLEYGQIGPAGTVALAHPSALPRLEDLRLEGNPIGDTGCLVLARWGREHGKDDLSFYHNGLTATGVAALAASGHLAGLRRLSFAKESFGDSGMVALANAADLANLECLSFFKVRITEAGARALARSPYLPRTMSLSLIDDHGLGEDTMQLLRERFPRNFPEPATPASAANP